MLGRAESLRSWEIRGPASHVCVRSGAVLLIGTVLAAMGVFLPNAQAADMTIWQIGKRNNASLEFNADWDFSKGKDPRFVVGKSNPKQDWSRFHPGPADPRGGQQVHPFTVEFDLEAAPRGTFYLTVDVMFWEPLIPQFVVEINGKKGRYYFRPTLSYDIGDPEWFHNIILSNQRIRAPLPASFLRQGTNTLMLSCVGGSGDAIFPLDGATATLSGIYYDALEFSNDVAGQPKPGVFEASARPTIFYRQDGEGKLRELVMLTAETSGVAGKGKATLQLMGQAYGCDLAGIYDFGESQCAVKVPEFTGTMSGKLTIRSGGRTRAFAVSLVAEKKWTLYEAPHNHIDTGYNDYRPKTYETHNRNIDQLVEAIEAHPAYRFNLDGTFDLEQYWMLRDEGQQERVVKLLRERRLGFPAQDFTQDTGLSSQEELIRLSYYSAAFSRRYGIPIQYAIQTDPPAHTWALPSYLHSMGVKHLVIACDQFRGPVLSYGGLDQKSPFWWEGPDGSKVLTWFSRHYIQMKSLFGRWEPIVQAGVTSLPIFLQAYASPSYKGDAALIYGTLTDNEPLNPADVGFAERWNKEFAYPKIVVANFGEFLRYMEENFADSFMTLRGDGGAWWEEMIASDAAHAAIWRKAKERILGAEVAASLGVIANRGFTFPLTEDQDIWRNLLLYGEHSVGGVPRTWRHPDLELAKALFKSKESFSTRAEMGGDNMLRRGLSQLADKIRTQGDTVVLFNALSWKRGGLVELDLPRGYGLTDLATQRPVPMELVRRQEEEDYDRVRFWAEGTPALGYRCYAISQPSSATPASVLDDAARQGLIENAFYRIRVDATRGGIASIYDKQLGRELVDSSSPYALGQYVYAGYGHEDASLIRQRTVLESTLLSYSTALPPPDLKVTTAGLGKVVEAKKTAWGTVLLMESAEAHTPKIMTEILLYDGEKRIELVYRLHKEVVRAPEGVYFAFPFAGRNPTIRYEIQNAWVDPTRDQLPGANKEWFAAQHWVAVTDGGHTVALALEEAPLFTIGDIVRGRWPKSLEIRNGTIFSYIMNNYDGDDEKPFQGGDFTFHYVLRSDQGWDPAALARFGREAGSRLEFDKVTSLDKRTSRFDPVGRFSGPTSLRESAGLGREETGGGVGRRVEPLSVQPTSFVEVEPLELILTTWKGAEDTEGYILRFYNTTDRAVEGKVKFPLFELERVYRCNLVEANTGEESATAGEVKLSLGPHEIRTLRVTGFKLRQR